MPTNLSPRSTFHPAMSLQTSGIRSELVHHFSAATGYAGGCTQHQREDAHYERGRKDGLGQALELVDTFLRSDERPAGAQAGRRGDRGGRRRRVNAYTSAVRVTMSAA